MKSYNDEQLPNQTQIEIMNLEFKKQKFSTFSNNLQPGLNENLFNDNLLDKNNLNFNSFKQHSNNSSNLKNK